MLRVCEFLDERQFCHSEASLQAEESRGLLRPQSVSSLRSLSRVGAHQAGTGSLGEVQRSRAGESASCVESQSREAVNYCEDNH